MFQNFDFQKKISWILGEENLGNIVKNVQDKHIYEKFVIEELRGDQEVIRKKRNYLSFCFQKKVQIKTVTSLYI